MIPLSTAQAPLDHIRVRVEPRCSWRPSLTLDENTSELGRANIHVLRIHANGEALVRNVGGHLPVPRLRDRYIGRRPLLHSARNMILDLFLNLGLARCFTVQDVPVLRPSGVYRLPHYETVGGPSPSVTLLLPLPIYVGLLARRGCDGLPNRPGPVLFGDLILGSYPMRNPLRVLVAHLGGKGRGRLSQENQQERHRHSQHRVSLLYVTVAPPRPINDLGSTRPPWVLALD